VPAPLVSHHLFFSEGYTKGTNDYNDDRF
jgi:hypothetical protein